MFSDNTTTTFTVTNGQDGAGGADIVTEWESTLSDEKIPSEKLTKNTIDTKATGTKVTSWSGTVSDDNIPSEKLVKNSLDEKLSATKVTNWSGTVSDANVPSEKLVKNSLDGKLSATKVTSWSGTVSDSNVPSEKLVKDSLDGKQATLVSGTNIKTVDGNSLLGSGNVSLTVGSFTELQALITNASAGDVIILDKDYKNSGSESQITINKNLTIIGNGHTINGDWKSRIFLLDEGTSSTNVVVNIIGVCFVKGGTSSTSLEGGAIYAPQYHIINLYDCDFNYNKAGSKGGAVYCHSLNTIMNCRFNRNHFAGYGGAIYCAGLSSSSNTIIGCSFNKNSSDTGGGAIVCHTSSTVRDCEFNGNTTTGNGANVYRSGSGTLTVYNCHVTTGLYNTVNNDDINSESKVTSWSSTVSNDNIPSEKLVKDTIDNLIGDINDYITG